MADFRESDCFFCYECCKYYHYEMMCEDDKATYCKTCFDKLEKDKCLEKNESK